MLVDSSWLVVTQLNVFLLVVDEYELGAISITR